MDEQLKNWKGKFGDYYVDRNLPSYKNLKDRRIFWNSILPKESEYYSILEIGANVGVNITAISDINHAWSDSKTYYAIEPNEKAREFLKSFFEAPNFVLLRQDSHAGNIELKDNAADLVFTCGVLIHIHPDNIPDALKEMYRVSRKYIIISEYFSPEFREIKYRGEDNMLWAGDYGGIMLDKYPNNLKLVATHFHWKRTTGMDNLTTWVFQKC